MWKTRQIFSLIVIFQALVFENRYVCGKVQHRKDIFMTDEERAYRKAELRSILVSVPIKAVAAGLIVHFSASSKTDFVGSAVAFIMFYSLLSIYAFVSKRLGNWIIGAIVIGIIGWSIDSWELPKVVIWLVEFLFIGGGFTLDAYRIFKYIRLSMPEKAQKVVITPFNSNTDSIESEQSSGEARVD